MNKRGFTLVETLVAIAIFAIVVSIGVGGFANALHTQGEVSSLIAAQSNASVALEQMAREIRTGYLFCDKANNAGLNNACIPQGIGVNTTGCSGSPVLTCKNIIDFYNAQGVEVDYALAPGDGATGAGALERSESGVGGYEPVTSNNVNIKYLTFTIFGTTEGDHWPPRITISMGVVASSTDPAVANDVINLQTTVSARDIDCIPGSSPLQC